MLNLKERKVENPIEINKILGEQKEKEMILLHIIFCLDILHLV